MTDNADQRPIFVVKLRAEPNCPDAARALKRLLKFCAASLQPSLHQR
jgi:hypothetical protein